MDKGVLAFAALKVKTACILPDGLSRRVGIVLKRRHDATSRFNRLEKFFTPPPASREDWSAVPSAFSAMAPSRGPSYRLGQSLASAACVGQRV